jgi:hypothetical protein
MYKDIMMERLHTRLKIIVVSFITLISSIAYSAPSSNIEKWYRVEVLVIESKDKSALAEEWPLNPGMPLLANAISLDSPSSTEISLLSDNQLTLGRAKKRLQQNYRLIMHKGWRQTLSDKATAQNIRLMGGQNYTVGNAIDNEVDGIIKLSTGRYMNVDADLVFHKPMKLAPGTAVELGVASENQGTARFELADKNWQSDPQARLQPFRLKESSRLKADEIHYIDHPLYGIIIVVSPEKTAS